MTRKLYICLVLLIAAASVASAQTLLGVDYSEPIPFSVVLEYGLALAAGTDAQGSVYLLANGFAGYQATAANYFITKLTPAGDQIVYQNALPFQATGMAVDPAGNVYLAGSNSVEKLGTDGKTVIYTTTIAPDAVVAGIAVDASGRAYVTGGTATGDLPATPGALQQTPPSGDQADAFVVRLKPDGAIDYATYLGGASQGAGVAIAVDAAGSAFVTGYANSADFSTTPGCYLPASAIPNFNNAPFLARLSADGSSLIYSTFTDQQIDFPVSLAVDSSDNAVLSFAAGPWTVVMRFNPQGTALVFSKRLPASSPDALAVDAAGNSYVLLSAQANFPVKNNLAICGANGTAVLAVFDAGGDLLQATYVAGSQGQAALALASGPVAYVFGLPDATYTPTRQFAGSSSGLWFLARYSANAQTQPVELACMGNGGSYDSTGITGGEIVSLFGEGIGPAAGTLPQVDLQTGFPKQLANVVVTFNGTPGPLLYVQNNQINAIAPWSLPTGQTVQICVTYNGNTTNCLARPVLGFHPGVFTTDGTYAAALNQDGTPNTAANPAPVGSTVSIFATGLGAVTPPEADGAIVGTPLPADVLPAEVYWLGSDLFVGLIVFQLDVTYAGPAPFEVAGASQINFVVEGSNIFSLQVGPPSIGMLIQPGGSRPLPGACGAATVARSIRNWASSFRRGSILQLFLSY
jgi:uncharacterized protein (TIGR03437 family)